MSAIILRKPHVREKSGSPTFSASSYAFQPFLLPAEGWEVYKWVCYVMLVMLVVLVMLVMLPKWMKALSN